MENGNLIRTTFSPTSNAVVQTAISDTLNVSSISEIFNNYFVTGDSVKS